MPVSNKTAGRLGPYWRSSSTKYATASWSSARRSCGRARPGDALAGTNAVEVLKAPQFSTVFLISVLKLKKSLVGAFLPAPLLPCRSHFGWWITQPDSAPPVLVNCCRCGVLVTKSRTRWGLAREIDPRGWEQRHRRAACNDVRPDDK